MWDWWGRWGRWVWFGWCVDNARHNDLCGERAKNNPLGTYNNYKLELYNDVELVFGRQVIWSAIQLDFAICGQNLKCNSIALRNLWKCLQNVLLNTKQWKNVLRLVKMFANVTQNDRTRGARARATCSCAEKRQISRARPVVRWIPDSAFQILKNLGIHRAASRYHD